MNNLPGIGTFEEIESNVRSYCRSFPVVFARAKGSYLHAESGDRYLDFLSGCGALNCGHNNAYIEERVTAHIESDSVMHAMDLFTTAKRYFLEQFRNHVLRPGGYSYKVQFPRPTGTNGVEAALKLARKATGRKRVVAFAGAFHGMTLGALSASSNPRYRAAAGVELRDVTVLPFPGERENERDALSRTEAAIERAVAEDAPACVILETIQAEGGINVAPTEWLRGLADVCRSNDVLLVCDEVQVGCGRTGPFFSFQPAGIKPDIVVLSKSIGGYGFPLFLVLIRPDIDVWDPGEHNGTFRGNQLGFVAGAAALEYREKANLQEHVRKRGACVEQHLNSEIQPLHDGISIRGRGLIWGVDLRNTGMPGLADCVLRECFENRLVLETAGHDCGVVKILPPLTATQSELELGCGVLRDSLATCMA